MFWMCNDETVINLDHVKYFSKEETENVPDSKPRIVFYLKNGAITDTYDTVNDRDYAYTTLVTELKVLI